jgi:hypothetical protein
LAWDSPSAGQSSKPTAGASGCHRARRMAPTSASLSRYGQSSSAPVTRTIRTSITRANSVDVNMSVLALGWCLSTIAVAFVPNGGWARRSTSIWLTGGSVDWVSTGSRPFASLRKEPSRPLPRERSAPQEPTSLRFRPNQERVARPPSGAAARLSFLCRRESE